MNLQLVPFAPEHVGALRSWYFQDAAMRHWLGGCPRLEILARRHPSFALLDDGAMVAVAICEQEDAEQPVATLTYAVAPAHRGRGFGHRLLTMLTAEPALAGIECFDAHVEQTNRASTRCLKAAGWTEAGLRFGDGELCVYQFERDLALAA